MTTIYIAYLSISIMITIWVARVLFKNGEPLLISAFNGDKNLAHSINQLLVVGFYLINAGYISSMIRSGINLNDAQNLASGLAVVSEKVGTALLILGCMHFGNLYILNRIRKSSDYKNIPAPVSPSIQLGK